MTTDLEKLKAEVRKACPKGFAATQEEVIDYLASINRIAPEPDEAGALVIGFDRGSDDGDLNSLVLSETVNGTYFVRCVLYGDDARYVERAINQAALAKPAVPEGVK